MIELLKQAAGKSPVTDRTPAEKALREFFVEVFAKRKAYESANKAFTQNGDLLLPASYSSIASIRSTKTQIDEMLQADDTLKRFWETGFLQSAKRASSRTNWSASDQERFMNGMQGSFNASVYLQAINAEIEWLKACRSLYDFADTKFSSIKVIGNQIAITDAVSRQEFNTRIEQINRLSADMTSAQATMSQKQRDVQSSLGISDKDIEVK
jgi:hypothetical protein